MKFISLEIQNFLAIGHGKINLNDRGLCLIQGENNDDSSTSSNGAGKSTIAEALEFCLYGVTARGISGDAVVNKIAKKETFVSVVIQDGDTFYEITRYRKSTRYKNETHVSSWTGSDPTVRLPLTKGTEKETQAVINQIMGCSLEVFTAAIYAGQEEMPDIPKMTDKQLKLLIEEAAGIERIEAAYQLARQKMTEAKSKHGLLLNTLTAKEGQLSSEKTRLATVNQRHKEFEETRELRKNNFDSAASLSKDNAVYLIGKLKEIKEEKVKAQIAEIDTKLSGYAALVKVSEESGKLANKKQVEVTRLESDYKHHLNKVREVKDRLTNAEAYIKKPCGACGKPGDEHDLDTFRKHVTEQLRGAVIDAKRAQEILTTTTNELSALVEDYETKKKAIPDVTEISNKRNDLNAKLKKAEAIKNDIKTSLREGTTSLEKAKSVMTEENPHNATIKLLQEGINKLGLSIKECKRQIDEAQAQVDLYNDTVKVFGPAGVRAHILDTVTPFLNERTADYLSALSDGNISAVWSTLTTTAKGDLKEKFNIEVANEKGAESFVGLSGGEKRKVRLATMLALQDLVASRATKAIQLYVCDEIDDALDPAGLERLMTVLDRKAREKGTVFVISHNSLGEWIPETITVVKSGGLSTIRE